MSSSREEKIKLLKAIAAGTKTVSELLPEPEDIARKLSTETLDMIIEQAKLKGYLNEKLEAIPAGKKMPLSELPEGLQRKINRELQDLEIENFSRL